MQVHKSTLASSSRAKLVSTGMSSAAAGFTDPNRQKLS